MDMALRDKFLQLWSKYFDGADLPGCFYYTDNPPLKPLPAPKAHGPLHLRN